MKPNEKGFLYPVIDEHKCIHCGVCENICPANATENVNENQIDKKVFSAWIKDKKVRKESSSGGIFSAIADYVLNKGGVVFGARWTDDLSVVLDYCTDRDGLRKFRGSKYVQARIEDNYKKAKEFLDDRKNVLFSGTPCQIAGLKSYLRKDYSNLITIDLICHGVPSPMVFKDYIQYMEKQHNDKVISVIFRYKKPAWSSCSVCIKFEHTIYINSVQIDPYFIGFAGNFYLRDSCLQCKYANLNRMGDITIADFWGYRASNWKMRDFDKGCSVIILNTQKGSDIFDNVSNNMIFEKKTIDDAIRGNTSLIKPYLKAENSDKFWEDYLVSRDFETVSQRYFIPAKLGSRNTLGRWMNRYIFLVPESVRNLIRRVRHRRTKPQEQRIP
jgi:coenzyme F420-reducing hydrogenase beta subunit